MTKLTEQWAKTRLAHQAMMLSDAQQTLSINRENLKAHHEMTNGSPPNPKEDMIHIGDVIQNLPKAEAVKPGLSKLAIAAMVAAGLATGGGAGLLLPMLASNLFNTNNITNQKSIEPQEFEIEWQLKDGQMEIGKPKRVTQ